MARWPSIGESAVRSIPPAWLQRVGLIAGTEIIKRAGEEHEQLVSVQSDLNTATKIQQSKLVTNFIFAHVLRRLDICAAHPVPFLFEEFTQMAADETARASHEDFDRP